MAQDLENLRAALVDRYEIERELGQGGMATVYLARDLKHDRRVAIKVLKPELAAIIGAERFLAEIRTTATLQHPHILPLFDSGQADSLLYYVMPYVDGESLRQRIDREKQLPVEEAVRIATEVAGALGYAHGRGVIHRDVKPENILLHDGQALVADFGISLALSEAGGTRLTETGLSLGTPHYMSPEQASGDRELDGRTDVYSLGCVLFEMLAGEPPHTGPTTQSVLAKLLAEEPAPLSTLRRSVPANVEAAVRKTLEKLPGDRFRSPGELTAALRDPGFRYGTEAVMGEPRRLATPLTVALALAVLVLSVLLWKSRGDAPSPSPSTRYALDLGGNVPARVNLGMEFALSPDGSELAYQGPAGGSTNRLWLKRAGEVRPRLLTEIDWAGQPFFSPDGERIAWTGAPGFRRQGLRYMSLSTGAVTQVADSGVWHAGGDWSDDGWLYVEANDSTIVRFSESTFERQQVTTLKDGEAEHVLPQVLPDGALLFTVWHESPPAGGPTEIAVYEPGEGTHRVIASGFFARYSETGHLLVVTRDGTVTAAPFDVDRHELEGPLTPVIDGVDIGPGGAALAISRSGDLLYASAPRTDPFARELTWVDRDGIARPFAEGWRAQFESVAIAPDSDVVAITVGLETETTLWVKHLDDSPPVRLTFEPGLNRRPTWPPGARTVGFISDRDGKRALYTKRADGLGSTELVFSTPLDVDQASWSQDGEWIAYRTGFAAGAGRDIFARRTGSDTTTIAVAAHEGVDEHSPAISPDGRFIAYVSDVGGRSDIWVRPFPDVESGRWQVSDRGGLEPVWARGGDQIFFRTSNYLVSASVQLDPTFRVTGVDTLFSTDDYFLQNVHPAYDVTSDASRFLMIREPAIAPELILVTNIGQLLEGAGN